jgi:glycosyltransferase involved in cell wall biosynthesis
MKAVLHDAAFERGGGMRVVEHTAQVLNAELYLGIASDEVIKRSCVDITRVSDMEIESGTLRGLYLMAKLKQSSDLDKYDVIFESGSGSHWYSPRDEQIIIRYIHSVPLSYGKSGIVPLISRCLREHTLDYADIYLSNSEQTQADVRRYLGKESEVLYPPVDISGYQPNNGDGFVTISRITERKGVSEIVQEFNERGEKLVVIGDGPMLDDVREMAEENVNVLGWVSEDRKREELEASEALVLNSGNESSGIVPIEALAAGSCVISRNGGYTIQQISNGENGYLYEDISEGIDKYNTHGVSMNPNELAETAEKYSLKNFAEQLNHILKNV